MKVKISKNEWLMVQNGINTLINDGEKFSMRFSYFLSKNKRLLTDEMKDITDQVQQKLKEYQEEIKNAKIVDENNKITDMVKFKEIENKYKNEHTDVNNFLKEDLELEIYSIELDNVDDIASGLFDLIFPLIKEPA